MGYMYSPYVPMRPLNPLPSTCYRWFGWADELLDGLFWRS